MLICLASERLLKKTNFFYSGTSVGNSFWVRNGGLCSLPPLALGCFLAQSHEGSVLAASLCEEHSYMEQFALYSGLQVTG